MSDHAVAGFLQHGGETIEAYARSIKLKDKITIIPIGDTHLGSRACDEKRLDRLLKWILDRPDTYVIGMGDYADMVIRQDLKRFSGSCVKEELNDMLDSMLNAQSYLVREKFKPLADAGKILGMAEGNHELSMKQHHSFDLMGDICSVLKVPYLGYSFLYRLTLKKGTTIRNCIIYGHHGHGGGRKAGGHLNRIEDAVTFFDADIFLMGHSHNKIGTRGVRLGITQSGEPKIIHKPVLMARTGTFLKTCIQGTTTYSEKAGYPPTDLGVVRIDLRFQGHSKELDIHVSE
jgi:hypothetical protein